MSATPPLSLVLAALSAKFYELNGAQPYFPPLTLGQFDNILYLKH